VSPFSTSESAIRAVEFVAACGVALSSIEWLASERLLRDQALLGWPISQLRHRALANGLTSRLLDPVFRYPGILAVLAVRLAAALFLVCGLSAGPTRAALTLLVAVTTVAIALRSPFGLDGSDQMSAFIFSTLALTRLFPRPTVESVFLWVLALQSCLAYFTAGFAKLVSPVWRSGAAISGIGSTRMYGSPLAMRLVNRRSWFCFGLAWSIILTECLFPVALFAPFPVTSAILVGGALFHIMSGSVMGLNTFIWSFVATYPAILWVHARIEVWPKWMY
jgi:hypothetical protein